MSAPGGPDLLVAARAALLDALEALEEHRDSLVLVGAQAIYLHTGAAPVALAEATKDSDLAVDPRQLEPDPRLEEAMRRGGFGPHPTAPQPGSWLSPTGVPVDLMVPERLAGRGSRRSGRIRPHHDDATRRAVGLEAAVIDHVTMTITALDPADRRSVEVKVAGPAALLVAKLHKLGERRDDPRRLNDKDAHDVYRLLVAIETPALAEAVDHLLRDDLSAQVTTTALELLESLFAAGPDAVGSRMAGRAEELVGDPSTVSAAVAALAQDLLDAIPHR